MPDPLAVVAEVRRACREADGHDPLDEAADLRLQNHGLADTSVEIEPGGFALRHHGEVDLAVHPEARGSGRGSRLAARILATDGPVRAWSHGDHPAAARIATRHGLARARELWVMRRPSAPVAVPEPPPGVVVRALRADDPAELDQLLAVNAAAFADHPEQGDLDRAGLAERMAQPWFDPAGVLLAVERLDGPDIADGGRLLAFHWTKQRDDRTGEVYVVGVDPAQHGRGLGRLVTAAGLAHLDHLGLAEVLLYVEADNDAAIGLYGSLGFEHQAADTHVQYRRRPPGP